MKDYVPHCHPNDIVPDIEKLLNQWNWKGKLKNAFEYKVGKYDIMK